MVEEEEFSLTNVLLQLFHLDEVLRVADQQLCHKGTGLHIIVFEKLVLHGGLPHESE